MVSLTDKGKLAKPGEPAWEIARLFPEQGMWSEWEYLSVTEGTNKFVEFTDGFIEVLAMPTMKHQLIVLYFCNLLLNFVKAGDRGVVVIGPLRVRLRPGLIREPDIMFIRKENASRMINEAWEGANLTVEVVSEDDKNIKRDWKEKRQEYAAAGIEEYWIVDPQEERMTVLTLAGTEYRVFAEGKARDRVKSKLLEGFEVSVDDVLGAGK